MNAPAVCKLTEDNCRTQQTVYDRCFEWAQKHGASIAQEKYILVYFTKAQNKHNTSLPLVLPTSRIFPSPFAQVLGMILNKKLSWQPHLQDIKSELATQTNYP
jgi:hypothetical protein